MKNGSQPLILIMNLFPDTYPNKSKVNNNNNQVSKYGACNTTPIEY